MVDETAKHQEEVPTGDPQKEQKEENGKQEQKQENQPLEEEKVEETAVKEDGQAEDGLESAELLELLQNERREKELYQERSLRFQADFSNYKKRVIKERERIIQQANRDLLEGFLPIIDNLERAIDSLPKEEKFTAGMKMILDQMLQYLSQQGLEQMDPMGQVFDPCYHEAVEKVVQEDCDEDTVIQVLQKGYSFQGQVLRAAVVKVAG